MQTNHVMNAKTTFECQGKTVKAYTSLVKSGSPVLAALIQQHLQTEKKGVVEIRDTSFNVFLQLLRFMKIGQVNFQSTDITTQLFVAADKYGVDALKEACGLQLAQTTSVENAARLLILAHQHNSSTLRQSTLKFMSENRKTICSRNHSEVGEWIDLFKNYPELGVAAMKIMVMA